MLLISLTMLSFNSFSQSVTNKQDSLVILPAKVAKQIAKDLVAFDATKLELAKTQELVLNLQNQVSTQAGIIKQYEIKDGQYKQIITNYDAQVLAYKNMTNELQKDLRKSKVKGFYNKFGLTLGLATMTYLYITK